jgi:hypothetical protein
MMKIDRLSAVDGPVGSEGGRSPSTLSTGQAPPTLTATPAAAQPPRLGPLAPLSTNVSLGAQRMSFPGSLARSSHRVSNPSPER